MIQLNKQFSNIVESGSNDYGYYTKFSNGLLICKGTGQIAANESSVDVYFPCAFINSTEVEVVVTNKWTYSPKIIWSAMARNAYYFRAWPYDITTGATPTVQGNFGYIAIGRWKS